MRSTRKELSFLDKQFILERARGKTLSEAAAVVGYDELDTKRLRQSYNYRDEYNRLLTDPLGRAEITIQNLTDEIATIAFAELEKEGVIKPGDKLRACELLGKSRFIKMFADVIEMDSKDDVARVKTVELEERIRLMETSRDPSLIEQD